MKTAHVIGAGLAGLGAAVALVRAGWRVIVSEASPHAGGRCRSYHDPKLGLEIDNGNHLVLSGNPAVRDYLASIGAVDALDGPAQAGFAFADLRDGRRWRVRLNDGRLPWWIAQPSRRVPGTGIADYLPLRRLLSARGEERVGDCMPTQGPLWERFVEPLLVAALNTPATGASAALAGAVLRETLAQGGRACRPRIARTSLAAAFVDPALATLRAGGAELRTGRRLTAIDADGRSLLFSDSREDVPQDAAIIVAVPSWAAAELIPGLVVPDAHHAIVNAHFACRPPPGAERMIGLIGGTAEWVFAYPDRLSVTVSAADRLCDEEREPLAHRIWSEVARVHALPDALPPWQIVRERRATFAATPEQERRRPPAATRLRNVFLAGDWTATGLPATIEGALRSGAEAARLAMRAES